MQPNANTLYDAALEHQRDLLRQAEEERLARLAAPPSRPWLDPAVWTAIIGPIVGLAFLAYFARAIAVALGA
jgi:hypothetical protein